MKRKLTRNIHGKGAVCVGVRGHEFGLFPEYFFVNVFFYIDTVVFCSQLNCVG